MLLEDLGLYLEDNGIGIRGTNLFTGVLPAAAPGNCVLLSEYPGAGSLRTSAGVASEQPRVQVMVRNADYAAARELAEEIYTLLDGVANEDINEVRYHWIEALSPPSILGGGNIDGSDRIRIVTNFMVMKERG